MSPDVSSGSVWDDHSWTPLPSLEGDLKADICVVGLGGSGLAAVHELLRLGVSVVGVDAGPVAGGAAGRNGGFLLAGLAKFYHQTVQKFGRERAKDIYQATLNQIDRMTEETPLAIRRVGSLRVADTQGESQDCLKHAEALHADGFAVEPYEGPEGRGILIPTDAAFNPLLRCRILAERATLAGARLFEHSPAVHISGNEVRTPKGSVCCKKVIVAVDGKLELLLTELSGKVRTARLQMLATAPTTETGFPRPVYARYGYEYWQQLPDGRIAVGGFRDLGGEAEWTFSDQPTPLIQAALEKLLRERLGVQAPITHRWAASVGYTQTGLPIIEEARPNVWAIGGYSGTGNVVGGLCGQAVAQIVTAGSPGFAGLISIKS